MLRSSPHRPGSALPSGRRLLGVLAGLWLAVLAAGPAVAQAPAARGHYLGLGGGMARPVLFDEQASPLHYTGRTWLVVLAYRHEGRRYQQMASFSYGPLPLTSAITRGEDHRVAGRGGVVRHHLTRRLGPPTGAGPHVAVGLAFEGEGHARSHNYTDPFDELFYLGVGAVGPAAMARYRLSTRGLLEARLALPLAGVVVRPPYAGKGMPTVRPAVAGHLLQVVSDLTYRHGLTRHLAVQAAYTLRYGRLETPFLLQQRHHHLTLQLFWKP